MSVSVYHSNIRYLYDEDTFIRGMQALNKNEQGIVLNKHHKCSRVRSLAVRLLLKEALHNIDIYDYIIEYDCNGKPSIADCKDYNGCAIRPNIYISMSHSGEYVACAIGDVLLGIDIERIKCHNTSIAKRFFNKIEYMDLLKAPDIDDRLFCQYWSAKEAYLKMCGIGISAGMNKCIVDWESDVILDATTNETLGKLTVHNLLEDYCIVVCEGLIQS